MPEDGCDKVATVDGCRLVVDKVRDGVAAVDCCQLIRNANSSATEQLINQTGEAWGQGRDGDAIVDRSWLSVDKESPTT